LVALWPGMVSGALSGQPKKKSVDIIPKTIN